MNLRSPMLWMVALLVSAGCPAGDDKVSDTPGPTDSDSAPDADGDGASADVDCDDDDPEIHPGAEERCNGLDDDCDGDTDEELSIHACYQDLDGDDVGRAGSEPEWSCAEGCEAGSSSADSDCDDSDPQVYPGADELCDLVDNDCDGEVDEGFEVGTLYRDRDGDGYGDPEREVWGCLAAEGFVQDNTDCDPDRSDTWPGAPEICDEADNDCDGEIDEGLPTTPWYADVDGDGHGDGSATSERCGPGEGWVSDAADCGIQDPSIYEGATEDCENGRDDDCDGLLDCEDESCVDVSSCGEGDCADGADEDDDGYTDCDDDECWGDLSCPTVVVSWVVGGGEIRATEGVSQLVVQRPCASPPTSYSYITQWDNFSALDVRGSARVYSPGASEGAECTWGVDRAHFRHRYEHHTLSGALTAESSSTTSTRTGFRVAGDCGLVDSGFLPALRDLHPLRTERWYIPTRPYTDRTPGADYIASSGCIYWNWDSNRTTMEAYTIEGGENEVCTSSCADPP